MVHHALEGVGVVVLARLHAHQTGGNVGAVVGNALRIVQHIEEHHAGINGADALFQAFDVLVAQTLHQNVDDFLDGLHLPGRLQIAGFKGIVGQLQDLFQCRVEDLQLALGMVAERSLLIGKLLRLLHDVHGVVADALVLSHEVQQLGHSVALVVAQLLIGHFNKVIGDLDLHPVDEMLPDVDGTDHLFVHLEQQRGGEADVAGGTARHLDHCALGLLQCHRRALVQTLIQHRHRQLLRLFRTVADGHAGDLDQQPVEGQQQKHCRHAGQRVDVGDGAFIHHIVPHRDADGILDRIDQSHHNDAADDVEIQVDESRTLAVLGRAADGQQRGKGRADVRTQNDGDGRAKGDKAGAGKCLQDAHRSRGGLDDHGSHQTDQHAEDGVGHRDKEVLEHRTLFQGSHAGVHQAHAGEQDAEAQHDLADVLLFCVPDKDIKNAANKRNHRRKGLRLHQGQPKAVTGDVRHADQLTGDSGTNVCAHDHAYGLRKGHDARVDKADTDDDRARRRLDDGGDEGAENNALEGRGGQLLQHALHLAARQFFKAGPHDRHSVQKQRNTAQQRGDVCDIHINAPKMIFLLLIHNKYGTAETSPRTPSFLL